jgi:enoyl-CoA hydratase/carnithine racemase
MSEDVVLYERRGHVALVTLNRPERRNALSPEVFTRLREVWDQFAADDEARVAVLTGAGDRAFCAGADLKVMNESGDQQADHRGHQRLRDCRRLVARAAVRHPHRRGRRETRHL